MSRNPSRTMPCVRQPVYLYMCLLYTEGSALHTLWYNHLFKIEVQFNKLWKILKEMGIPDHLTHLLRNLYAGQELTVTTGHGTTDWFQIGKGVRPGCILSPCYGNLTYMQSIS